MWILIYALYSLHNKEVCSPISIKSSKRHNMGWFICEPNKATHAFAQKNPDMFWNSKLSKRTSVWLIALSHALHGFLYHLIKNVNLNTLLETFTFFPPDPILMFTNINKSMTGNTYMQSHCVSYVSQQVSLPRLLTPHKQVKFMSS